MIFAIVSDIHANLQAWNAVHEDILRVGVDEIICLGDIVGYGPDPGRVLDSVYANCHHFVMGDHDAAVAGIVPLKQYGKAARRTIEWTREELDDSAIGFLQEMPLVLGNETFLCAHADAADPGKFRYIHQPADAKQSWDHCPEQMMFISHTHIPGIHMIGKMGVPHYLPPQDLRCNREMRYMVNTGSVGQPRDGNVDACYCVYDVDREMVTYRRVSYDVQTHLDALAQRKFPAHPSFQEGQLANPQEMVRGLEFHPLDEARQGAPEAVQHRSMSENKQGRKHGKKPGRRGNRGKSAPQRVQQTQKLSSRAGAKLPGKSGEDRGAPRRRKRRGGGAKKGSSTALIMAIVIGILLFGMVVAAIAVGTRPKKGRKPLPAARRIPGRN